MTNIQKIYSIFSKVHVFLILVGILVGASVIFSHTAPVYAGPNDNVIGFAWSDMPDGSDEVIQGNGTVGRGAGWISLNSDGRRADGSASGYSSSIDYGITIDMSTGAVSGYGWSEHMGWIDFSGVSMDPVTGILSGNAQVVIGGSPQSGGWDGVVSMSGTAVSGDVYGVAVDVNSTGPFAQLSGFAWGDKVMGWIDFGYASVEIVVTNAVCTDPLADNYTPLGSTNTSDNTLCNYSCNTSACNPGPSFPGTQVCTNDSSLTIQQAIQDGLVLDSLGNCYEENDMCINNNVHPGIQTSIPSGYIQTSDGYCILEPTSPEICGNGIDDDGDGDIDEGCVGPGTITVPIFEEI